MASRESTVYAMRGIIPTGEDRVNIWAESGQIGVRQISPIWKV